LSRKNIFELNLEEINVVSSTKLGLYTLGSIDYIVLIIIVISLLYFLIRKFLSRPKNIRLIKEKMIYGFKRIELSELEKSFLNLFLNNNALENIELVNLIGSEIDASQKSRIKNSTIESLNLKISLITNYKFQIKKYPSSSDRRYYSYKLLKNF
jgi:hypothetical protein